MLGKVLTIGIVVLTGCTTMPHESAGVGTDDSGVALTGLDSSTAAISERINARAQRRTALIQQADAATDAAQRLQLVREAMELDAQIAEMYAAADMPVEALQTWIAATERGQQVGIGHGETSPIGYGFMRFTENLLLDGKALIKVLSSPAIDQEHKRELLRELADKVDRNDWPDE